MPLPFTYQRSVRGPRMLFRVPEHAPQSDIRSRAPEGRKGSSAPPPGLQVPAAASSPESVHKIGAIHKTPYVKAGDSRDRRGRAFEVGWTPALPELLYAMGLPGLNHPIGSGVVRGAPHEATAEQSRAQTYETALSPRLKAGACAPEERKVIPRTGVAACTSRSSRRSTTHACGLSRYLARRAGRPLGGGPNWVTRPSQITRRELQHGTSRGVSCPSPGPDETRRTRQLRWHRAPIAPRAPCSRACGPTSATARR